MGYIRHHAITVTSWGSDIERARIKAKQVFENRVTNIIKSKTNSFESFLIVPDGSKEGWEESEEGDKRRKEFIEWIEEQADEDGSNCIQYAEYYYGDDENKAKMINHN